MQALVTNLFWCGVIQLSSWKALASKEATRQNCRLDIVLATVEAETNGQNISGDGGNAVGYGQVWPQWHMDKFTAAAKELGLTIPTDQASLVQFTLNNDLYSMAVTVKTIKAFWESANYNWRSFTLSYVGPAIPDSDYARREKIWLRYKDSSETIETADTPINGLSSAQVPVPLDTITSNYEVIKNSARWGDALIGRRYRVIVRENNDVALDVSKLRCTFRITKTLALETNYCEVSIYNLNANTENSIIAEGNRIILEAGYEGEQYGLIFDGDVLQPIREKEDGVTYKLTLISLDGDRFLNAGIVNFTLARGQTARNIVEECTARAENPSELGSISESLSGAKLTRGKVFFGLAKDYLRQLAQSENSTFYVNDNKVNIIRASDLPEGEIIDLSPQSGLIGTPTQTEYGVAAKCLLNPRINLNTLVHIDNSLVRERQQQIGQIVRNLDGDGIYRVIKITHSGDTRGDEWYTEIETVTQAGFLPNMVTNSSASPW